MRKPKVINNNGSCYIRFRYLGREYVLNPGGRFEDKLARSAAEQITIQIYNDLITGNFDFSLDKYRKYKKPEFVEHLKVLELRLSLKYSVVDDILIRILKAYKKEITSSSDVQNFLNYLSEERGCSKLSIKRYLTVLKVIDPKLFGDVKLKGVKMRKRKPFSKVEVEKILNGFKEYKPHYYNYVFYLFNTGCRTSEAIGIRWIDINFESNEIYIGESLGRSRSSSAYRERRGTKTGRDRIFPMSPKLKDFLFAIYSPEFNKNDLVFKSPKGFMINDRTFAQKIWRDILNKKGVEHRPPYTTRHTFISHCLEAGINPVKLSEITDHDVDTLYKYYAGVIDKIEIPDLF